MASEGDLAARLAEKQSISQDDAKQQVAAVFTSLAEELSAGKDITVRRFGKFYVQHRDARKGRNPKTGAEIQIPAKRYPKFSSSDVLKAQLNK